MQYIYSIFHLFFQEGNHKILLLLRISLDTNPVYFGIPYLLGFCDQTKVIVTLKIRSGLRHPDEWQIEQTLMIPHCMLPQCISC